MVCAVLLLLFAFIENLLAARDTFFKGLIPYDYNKNYAPSIVNPITGSITHVKCAVNIITVVGLSAKTMDIKVEAGFYLAWLDSRLNLTVFQNTRANVTTFPQDISEKLWHPTLLFGNCKECHGSIYEPQKYPLKYNHVNSHLYVSARHSNTYFCKFDMSRYPFDKQICSIKIVKYNYIPILITYEMYPNHKLSNVNTPPEWTLDNITQTECNFDSSIHDNCHSFNVHLLRNRGRTILIVFIPSSLIVILSWISFWLDPAAAAPRVALGLTSMLTLTTQFGATEATLPAVSTIMGLDIWMFACIFIVFASLVEYAVVNYLSIRMSNSKKSNIFRRKGPHYSFLPPDEFTCIEKAYKMVKNAFLQMTPSMVDGVARILFPITFLIFNITFWVYYIG